MLKHQQTRRFGKSVMAAVELRRFLLDVSQDKVAMVLPMKGGFIVRLFEKSQFKGLGIRGLE